MTNKTFSPGTVIDSPWLNDINDTVYDILGDGVDPPATKAAARTNLGLGTVATQPANNVSITGGTLSGVTLTSPVLTGNPTAPTPAVGDNDTSVATSAFVQRNVLTGNLFKASRNTLLSYPSGTATVVFDVKEFDVEGGNVATAYNTTTGRFTPTVAGYYNVSAAIRPSSPGGNILSSTGEIYKNGVSYIRLGNIITSAAIQQVTHSGSSPIFMNGTTDYLTVVVTTSTSAGAPELAALATAHYFSAFYIHP